MAQELRKPHAPIRNALHLIQLEIASQPPSLQENWEIIERQVTHLVRLVDDLLDVSRINEGKIQLQKEQVGLKQIVSPAVATSGPLLESRRHNLEVAPPGEELGVVVHPARLSPTLPTPP